VTYDDLSQHAPDTGELPSLAREARQIAPHSRYSRYDLVARDMDPMQEVLMPRTDRNCPYRTQAPSGVSIERGPALSCANNAPALHKANRHLVLYTHDSPFIQSARNRDRKMSSGDFEKLAERYMYSAQEIQKFHKYFGKLTIAKGIDQEGLALFIGKFCNVDPTDSFVCRRLFELTNKRNHETVTFDQVLSLMSILKPPENVFDPERLRAQAMPSTIAKADLFFSVCDTNETGELCLREIRALSHVEKSDKVDISKERRKVILDNVMGRVFEFFNKDKHNDHFSRDQLIHVIKKVPEVHKFFAKGLYLAANLEQQQT